MAVKMIQLIILVLVCIFEGESDKCKPCSCFEQGLHESWNINLNFPWVLDRPAKNNFYWLNCYSTPNLYNIPSDTPNNINAMWLTDVEVGKSNGVTRNMFEKFTRLEFLALDKIYATTVDLDIFYPHRNILKHLSLLNNPLVEIPVGTFQKNPSFASLYLHYNQFRIIRKGLFTNMPSLRILSLYNNKIELIEIAAFHNMPKLLVLDLQANMLTFVDINIFDNPQLFSSQTIYFHGNPWYCNDDLCPFMHYSNKDITCHDPKPMKEKPFREAVKYVGTKVDRVRHVKRLDEPVEMICSTCDFTKSQWRKEGSETLPPGVSIKHGARTATLAIDKVFEMHGGNYTCYNPTCTESDCPKKVVSLTVSVPEPNWNFTGRQAEVDEAVRYGEDGYVFFFISLAIFTITMSVCMSGYWIYVRMKRDRARAEQQQLRQEDDEL